MVLPKDDIVISGIGGYFPNAANIEEWKQQLFNNEIHLGEKWHKDREESNLCGVIDASHFDNSFFGIHRLLTTYMDPLSRSALERTFEALVDAGVNLNYVKGKKIGCFVGTSSDEVSNVLIDNVKGGYGLLGHARCMLANRISYWLNIKGPSVTYDMNWVTGLEAIHSAVETISKGECDAALVGAGNLIIFPEFQTTFKGMNMISPDGSTKAFDINASGYTRTDGVVMLYIQRASDAKRSYGSIVHLKSQFHGNDNSELLTINSPNITEFLQDFYKSSPVKPQEIDYVETHGCGIKDIDKAEIDAIESVYCKDRKTPLLVGSVKTQSGHSDCCSSLFSIVKVLIAMEEEMMPATLQIETLNPDIKGLHNGNIEVVRKNMKWNSEYAAVHSIGANNYYSHVIIRRNPLKKGQIKCNIPALLPVSTRTEENIKTILARLKEKPNNREYHRLIQEVFSETTPLHMFRGYVLCGEEIKTDQLYQDGAKRQVWFVYSGMGSQWNGMISDLMDFPIVAKSIAKSHETLLPHGIDLMNILTTDDKTVFDNILNCFVGIAAVQIALTDLLSALEIVPDGIIGHSVGELGCAYADGCVTAEEMLLAAYYRGKASLEANLIKGMMAAIGQGYHQIKDRLPTGIEAACHNGSESCTLSGPTEIMEQFVQQLVNEGIFARLVNVANIAYHSQYIKPIGPLLHKYLTDVLRTPKLRSKKWISTSNKVDNWNTELAKYSSADYHTNNLLNSVFFEEGCKYIPKDAILIEIAPHGLLQAILKRSFKSGTSIPLTKRGSKSATEFLLQNLGALYLQGLDFKIANIYPDIDFPVSRGTPTLSNLVGWNYGDKWHLDIVSCYKLKYICIDKKLIEEYVGYKITDNGHLPLHFYLRMVYSLLNTTEDKILFENLHFRKHIFLPKDASRLFYASVHRGTGEFELGFENDVVLTGKVTFSEIEENFTDREEIDLRKTTQMDGDEFYAEMKSRGYKYNEVAQILKRLTVAKNGSISQIALNQPWWIAVESLIQHQSFIIGEKYQNMQLPKTIGHILIETTEVNEKNINGLGYFYSDTNILIAPGIEMKNIEMMSWELEDNSTCVETIEYIPLNDHSFQDIGAALEFATQITLKNFNKPEMNSVLITYWTKNNNKLLAPMKNLVKSLPHLNVTLSVVKNTNQLFERQMYPQLLVVDDEAVDDVLKFISCSSAFLFTKRTETALAYSGIVEVANFNVQSKRYAIFRKITNTSVLTLDFGDSNLNNNQLTICSSDWASQLTKLISESKNKKERIFVTTSAIPIEGFEYFIKNIRAHSNMQNVHFIFNPKNTEVDLKAVIQKNLVFSLVINNTLHTAVPLSKNRFVASTKSTRNKNLQKQCIKYLSVNPKDETLKVPICKNDCIGNFDYSGFDSSGKMIMGLAKTQEDSSQLKVDEIFSWEVPEEWSLQDAVTIPHAYICAYNMLIVNGELRTGETVLIHGGCTPIGLAAISIATSYNCSIFTTVETVVQRMYLRENALYGGKLLNKKNVIVVKDSSFYEEVMSYTNGLGVHIVLNCYASELIQVSLKCCTYGGKLFHYGNYDICNGSNIHMRMFNFGTSFYYFLPKNVDTIDKESKEQIWNLISSGIETGIVKPLKWNTCSHSDIYDTISYLKKGTAIGKMIASTEEVISNNEIPGTAIKKFTCYPNNTYLVCGNSENCWDVVEWLVYRGAKRIVLSTDSKYNTKKTTRKMFLLKKYFNAQIVSEENIFTASNAALSVISQNLGPIHAIFLLPNDKGNFMELQEANILTVDGTLRKTSSNTILINFIPSIAGIFQIRRNSGFATYNIDVGNGKIWDGLNAFVDIFQSGSFDAILHRRITNLQIIPGPRIILPSLDELIENQKQNLDEPHMMQVITEGSVKYREVAPVFIITGLTGQVQVKKMTKNLLYPTYCTVLPKTAWPIDKLAKLYAQEIIQIYPKNIYNLVSVSTGGALTMEIARELNAQKKNVKLHLFFINSAPTTIQKEILQLGEDTDFEVNILRTIFQIHELEIINQITSISNWKQRVEFCTKLYTNNDRNRIILEQGLLSLKHWTEILKNYKQQITPISGMIHLLRPATMNPNDDCDLSRYLQQQPVIKVIDGDELDIINHEDTVEYINLYVDV